MGVTTYSHFLFSNLPMCFLAVGRFFYFGENSQLLRRSVWARYPLLWLGSVIEQSRKDNHTNYPHHKTPQINKP